MNKIPVLWLATIALTVVASVAGTTYYFTLVSRGKRTLVVSTTTSLYDTGLLEAIQQRFKEKFSIDAYFISVGSGQAIQQAMRGDADAILVHAPSSERTFLDGGYGVCRKIVAYNFFIIVGAAEDPAEIRNLTAREALTSIVNAGRAAKTTWVSRGDESGTHMKEKELWRYAGFNWDQVKEELWFMETGSGMGNTLLITNERGGYTLTDIATYLQYFSEGPISLEVLVGEDEDLLNVYSVIITNPSKVPRVNFEDAVTFTKFLISDECQNLIENYLKYAYGRSLFFPAVNLLKENSDPVMAEWIRNYAFFNGTECPPEYQGGHSELYGR